jgi:hypothetical protein
VVALSGCCTDMFLAVLVYMLGHLDLWGCFGRWLMPYMLLLKVPEHAMTIDDCCCHSYLSFVVSCGLISHSFRLGFPLFHAS